MRWRVEKGDLLGWTPSFIEWIANRSLTWTAYRAFMSGRMIALDKQPGVRLIGVGETRKKLFAKCMLRSTGPKTTSACQDDQICARLKAGIDGTAHRVQAIWYTKLTTDDWGFLLIDTKKYFNEINKIVMQWTVYHLWPSGARFIFSCYRHWSSLVLRNRNGTSIFLHSREGVKQREPLAMVAYGIGILLLIKNLKAEFTDIAQPWYADNASALGMFTRVG